ncbi:uroporphyrinogen-III C-methyltransferase [uncultured Metabacillus sp.]|uniref:uroporphyrinogen-III C-methyltransferase n=1 Tax=Metabacillus sp. Hm71 TaxID=3450743 RepID=UPI00262013AC|nr:uroporphyrinogen-III C-methyltransferase [uncultured Metabacillus sp.]
MSIGKVYLVGAGPGDPKLITVYGLECIQKADVIVYDRLISKDLLKHAKKDAELIYCGKLPGKHELIQEQIHEVLVEKAFAGKEVVRLKGGDPFVFGRGAEEAEVLRNNGIPYEVIPGITSGIAAPAYAGIPVTHRDFASSFAIVTGHGREEKKTDTINWEALAKGIDTIAFYMGIKNLPYICEKLIEYGKSPEALVSVIQWGTTPSQVAITGTLATIVDEVQKNQITHPAIVLVGQVAELREKIKWFEDLIDHDKEEM